MDPRKDAGQAIDMQIYILHFSQPVGGKRHYVGATSRNAMVRLHEHREGGERASDLCRKAVKLGVHIDLGHVWIVKDGDWETERRLKRSGHAARYCQICQNGERACPAE